MGALQDLLERARRGPAIAGPPRSPEDIEPDLLARARGVATMTPSAMVDFVLGIIDSAQSQQHSSHRSLRAAGSDDDLPIVVL